MKMYNNYINCNRMAYVVITYIKYYTISDINTRNNNYTKLI